MRGVRKKLIYDTYMNFKKTIDKQAAWPSPHRGGDALWGRGGLYVRQALHMMKEERLFSCIYIAGTALAIAFTMVIVMAYNFKIAPIYPEVNRVRTCYLDGIVNVSKDGTERQECGGVSQEIVDRLRTLKSVEEVGTMLNYTPDTYVQKPDGDDMPIIVQWVDDGFFKVYQFDFIEGKPFTPEEWKSNSKKLILTDKLARKVFGKTEGLVGGSISIDHEEYTIGGIVKAANVVSTQSYAEAYGCDYSLGRRRGYWGDPWGKGDIYAIILTEDPEALRNDINQMYAQINQEFEARGEEWRIEPLTNELITHTQQALSTHRRSRDADNNLLYLVLTFITLLIVPAVNLSGIISGRMESRLAEMGVRKAFGAHKSTLLNQILAENFVLTFIGSVLGLLLAWGLVEWGGMWMLDALGFCKASYYSMDEFIATGEMLFAPVVFVSALLFCLLINTLAAILPAWLSLRKPIVESMMEKR